MWWQIMLTRTHRGVSLASQRSFCFVLTSLEGPSCLLCQAAECCRTILTLCFPPIQSHRTPSPHPSCSALAPPIFLSSSTLTPYLGMDLLYWKRYVEFGAHTQEEAYSTSQYEKLEYIIGEFPKHIKLGLDFKSRRTDVEHKNPNFGNEL